MSSRPVRQCLPASVEATMNDLAIRTLAEADLDQALAINEAAVPAVNSRDRETLASYLRQSVAAPAGYDGETLAGFLICVGENADYESVNYDWISGTFDTFAYVDRIAIAEAYRNRGLGQRLYDAAIAEIDRRHVRLVCEVNRDRPTSARRLPRSRGACGTVQSPGSAVRD
ncbi:MAG: GNAT family N-acetyltransferase [Pseudomonadota bacterium]